MKNILLLTIITLAISLSATAQKKATPVIATPVQQCVTTVKPAKNSGNQPESLEDLVKRTAIVSEVYKGYNAYGKVIAESLGTVTNIKKIVNRTPCPVKVRKVDKGSKEVKSVGARGSYDGDFWIPWANNADEYKGHHMIIEFDGKPVFWLWQEGPSVRFGAKDGYVRNAPSVPGLAKSGGDRTLFVDIIDNTPILVFSSH